MTIKPITLFQTNDGIMHADLETAVVRDRAEAIENYMIDNRDRLNMPLETLAAAAPALADTISNLMSKMPGLSGVLTRDFKAGLEYGIGNRPGAQAIGRDIAGSVRLDPRFSTKPKPGEMLIAGEDGTVRRVSPEEAIKHLQAQAAARS